MLCCEIIVQVEVIRSDIGIIVNHRDKEPERNTAPHIVIIIGPEDLVTGSCTGKTVLKVALRHGLGLRTVDDDGPVRWRDTGRSNGLHRGGSCCFHCCQVCRIGDTSCVIELDLISIIEFDQVHPAGRVIVPVLVDIVDVGIPVDTVCLVTEVGAHVVQEQCTGSRIVLVGHIVGEPGCGRCNIQCTHRGGPADGIGCTCVVGYLVKGLSWGEDYRTIKEHVHDRARGGVGNNLDRSSGCCLYGSEIGWICNAGRVVELDLVTIIQLYQVQTAGRVVVPILVDIVHVGIPVDTVRFVTEVGAHVVQEQCTGSRIVLVGHIVGEPGCGRGNIQCTHRGGPADGIGCTCVVGYLVKGLSWGEDYRTIKEHVHRRGGIIAVDGYIADKSHRESRCSRILLGTTYVIVPVSFIGRKVPVIISENVVTIGIY